MFFNEEGNEAAVEFLIKNNRPMGRIIYPLTSTVFRNCHLGTIDGGSFWYGDIDTVEDHDILAELCKEMKWESLTMSEMGV